MAEGWRTFDHTGDLGLEVWAATPEALYGRAAEALAAQIAEPSWGEAEVRRDLTLEGDDPVDLLVHWLNATLLEGELLRAVWTRAHVHALGPRRLSATLEGQRLDPGRQVFLREVKAVSHHLVELDLERRPCRCRLVLDL
jgi:SHS2 domain-containing protein